MIKTKYLKRTVVTLMVFLFSFIVFKGISFADTDEARLAYEFKTLVNHCNYQPANDSAYCTSELYKTLKSIGEVKSKEDRKLLWPLVQSLKGSYAAEASMNLFIDGPDSVSRPYLILIRKHYSLIMGDQDADLLLKRYLASRKGRERSATRVLLSEITGGLYVDKFYKAYKGTNNREIKKELFGMITRQNNQEAMKTALSIISSTKWTKDNDLIGYVLLMGRFTNSELEDTIVRGLWSSNRSIRLASYIMIRKYPNESNLSLIKELIKTLGNIDEDEEKALETTLKVLNSRVTAGMSFGKNIKESKTDTDSLAALIDCSVPPGATDLEIAYKVFPQLRLSSPGDEGGVDLRTPGYPYQDYLPISIMDITTRGPFFYPTFCHGDSDSYFPLDDRDLLRLGQPNFRPATNAIDLMSVWKGVDYNPWPFPGLCKSNQNHKTNEIETAYRDLNHNITYYYKVFRNNTEGLPTAIQFWFFYFYNDWLNDHAGDWESITIFLDPNGDPVETAYSTHNEANRHSWDQMDPSPIKYSPLAPYVDGCHPVVNVANGSHGSYASIGNTDTNLSIDNHDGALEHLWPSSGYNLKGGEAISASSLWFEGNWGGVDGAFLPGFTAPKGPMLRTDASWGAWEIALNKPRDPKTCEARYDTSIYGTTIIPNDVKPGTYYGPWKWAEGYGLDGAPCGLGLTWAKTYGGGGSDIAQTIQQTSDGGYIVAGYTEVGNYGLWVLKLDASGNVTWQKTYGGVGNNSAANSIWQTTDGGYIVVGYTDSYGAGSIDLLVLKLDASGKVIWQKTYGGIGYDYGNYIKQTLDGGYIVAGTTASYGAGNFDAWVLKLDASGNVTWQKTYGENSSDDVRTIQQTPDGGYIVAGVTYTYGAGDADAWVLKLDANGNVTWQKTYGGAAQDTANSIVQTIDGGYIVAGETASYGEGGVGNGGDAWVLVLDASGNITWQKTYGAGRNERLSSLQQTTDGGYIVAGYTNSYGAGNNDFWVLKLDGNGDIGGTCGLGAPSNATPSDTAVTPVVSSAVASNTAATVTPSTTIPLNTTATTTTQCSSP